MIFSSESVKSRISTLSWPRRAAEQRRLVGEVGEVGADHARGAGGERVEVDVVGERDRARVDLEDLALARRGRAAARRRGGRSARAAAAPGRGSRAGWSRPSTTTASAGSKPSISVRIWSSVCSRSSLAPVTATEPWRERPIASSSSMKMIAGAASLALANRSRTREAPTPTIASMNSEAEIEKNAACASPATARASSVLPVPGRPGQQHAVGHPPAEAPVAVGVAQEVDDLGQLGLGLVDPGDVVERDADLLGIDPARLRAAEVAERAHPAAAARGAPREQHEQTRRSAASGRSRAGSRPAATWPGRRRLRVDLDVLFLQQRGQLGVVPERRDLGREQRRRRRLLVAGG